jgi:hypothetical protein
MNAERNTGGKLPLRGGIGGGVEGVAFMITLRGVFEMGNEASTVSGSNLVAK